MPPGQLPLKAALGTHLSPVTPRRMMRIMRRELAVGDFKVSAYFVGIAPLWERLLCPFATGVVLYHGRCHSLNGSIAPMFLPW